MRGASGPRSRRRAIGCLLACALAAGCGNSIGEASSGLPLVSDAHGCVEASQAIPLPPALRESSGVAPAREGDFYWSHNDSGYPPDLFAVSATGELLGTVRVTGARNVDWEDLASGPCPGGTGHGPAGACLYIADLGDNLEVRDDPAIYRVPEPLPGDSATLPADRFPIRLPHGPRDVEAMYLLPGERLFFVTKGRSGPIELYRVPPLGEPGRPLVPERIQVLADRPPSFARFVTGAGADPDGEWVAVRTYETLAFFRPEGDGTLRPTDAGRVNLRPLREVQGEAVALTGNGRVVLTSEAGPGLRIGSMRFLECELLRSGGPG